MTGQPRQNAHPGAGGGRGWVNLRTVAKCLTRVERDRNTICSKTFPSQSSFSGLLLNHTILRTWIGPYYPIEVFPQGRSLLVLIRQMEPSHGLRRFNDPRALLF